MSNISIEIKGNMPIKQTPGASGFDVAAAESVCIAPGGRAVISTGMYVSIPSDYEGQVRPRSGLSTKYGIVSCFGTIDSDYRGEVKVCLINFSNTPFHVKSGDRIAQIVFVQLPEVQLKSVEVLNPTERGEKGFGSTGINESIK
jgi:dUTP pyrophosphatase